MDDPETTSFADEGFGADPARKFIVEGHSAENTSGTLGTKIVVERDASDDVTVAANRQGIKLFAVFDATHPTLALLEAFGDVNFIEHLAKDLAAMRYERLPNTNEH
jgi:hypothetical protein